MDSKKIMCLTFGEADGRAGRTYNVLLALWSVYLGIPFMILPLFYCLNPEQFNGAGALLLATVLVGVLIPPFFIWRRYKERDRAFVFMLEDPEGKQLLERGDFFVRTLKLLEEGDAAMSEGLHRLNVVSGSLGEGTPPVIMPMFSQAQELQRRLRAQLLDRAYALREEQDALLRKIRAEHNLPEPPEPPPAPSPAASA